MRDKFPGYYRPSDADFQKLWKNALFVFDANVLLNMYRYPESARNDFIKILGSIKNRLWIPHQVALEYQENRLAVIEERSKKYDDVGEILKELDSQTAKLEQLHLKERHHAINPDEFIKQIRKLISSFSDELLSSKKTQMDISDEDKLREVHEELFDGKVGEPLSDTILKQLYQDGKPRYEQKRPPGYRDHAKTGNYLSSGQIIERKFGDLIVWWQILEEVKGNKHQCVIFVTDDGKEDWWWIYKGKTIGPRPELVDEIKVAGCEMFYMYSPTQFLTFAQKFLNTKIQGESITQVEAISAEQKDIIYKRTVARRKRIESLGFEARVAKFLTRNFSEYEIVINKYDGLSDFIGISKTAGSAKRIGFEVTYIRSISSLERTHSKFSQYVDSKINDNYEYFYLVCVVDTMLAKQFMGLGITFDDIVTSKKVRVIVLHEVTSETGEVIDLHPLYIN